MLVGVYTCQNATLLEISCTGLYVGLLSMDNVYSIEHFRMYALQFQNVN